MSRFQKVNTSPTPSPTSTAKVVFQLAGSTRSGHYLPLPLKKLACARAHAHTDEDWLCQDNTIFNLLLKVRFRYHRCQQHSFVSQQRNSSHIRLGFGRRQALGLLDFNKPIHVEGCLLSSSLTSTFLSTISHPLTAKDFSLAITIKWPL